MADLAPVLASLKKLPCEVLHVLGNHCVKFVPRETILRELNIQSKVPLRAYYSKELGEGWELVVLDTTEISIHGGWPEDSPEHTEALAFMKAHAGEDRVQRYNGGVSATQLAWLRSVLAEAKEKQRRVIVASHHCVAVGACRETHRAWNGDEVASLLDAHAGTVVLALAGHDHLGGFALSPRGLPFVTLQALLEAPLHGNAFGVVRVHADRIAIDGCGTAVSDRTLPLQPLPAPPPKADAGRGAKAAVPALAALAAAPPPKRRHWLRGKAKM